MADTISVVCGDGDFGPGIPTPGCRGGFDFTMLFENTMLSIAPAAGFLLLMPLRALQLWRRPTKVKKTLIYDLKLATAGLFFLLEIAVLVCVTQSSVKSASSIAGASLNIGAAAGLILLTHLEHIKSIRPSFLISLYLAATLLFDVARVRTAWLLSTDVATAAVLTVSIVAKLLLVALETREKRKSMLLTEKEPSLESTSGPFNRGLFVWLNGLLASGYSSLLSPSALPATYEELESASLLQRFRDAWMRVNRESSYALFWAVLKCLRWEIAVIAIPRLSLVALRIAQPFMISRAVAILQLSDEWSLKAGYGLIGAFALVLIGTAVMKAAYEHLGFRATTMIRGGLIALVYEHMMVLPLGGINESSAMSLMGSDIEALAEYFHATLCDTWANVVQLGIAIWLLYTQIGAVCVAPIIVAIGFTTASLTMGKAISTRQTAWLEATKDRINLTTEILGSIKIVKLLGLTEAMESMIERSRTDELTISKRFRRLQVLRICIINLPPVLGQLAAFAAYAIVAKIQGAGTLSVTQAVTSLALIDLLISPLQYLLMAIPDTFSSLGCLSRIQDFLRREPRQDPRSSGLSISTPSPPSIQGAEIGLSNLPQKASGSDSGHEDTILSLEDAEFGWAESSSTSVGTQGEKTFNLNLRRSTNGHLVMVVGPVGSGKSTFLRGLAGEVPLVRGRMFIKHPDMAFCEQSTWMANASIRDNITGESDTSDPKWYNEVVRACALETDFARLPRGDGTLVGSKGTKLSGGQKQRIAIARAVYSRKPVACFDDVLSGLDNTTRQDVFTGVFGPDGLLRRIGCTVFLATHSVQHLPSADLVIALGDRGRVVEMGTFDHLSGAGGYVQSLDVVAKSSDDEKGDTSDQDQLDEPVEALVGAEATEEDRPLATDLAVYRYYFSSLGWPRMGVFITFLIMNSFCGAFLYVWLTMWSGSSDSASNSRLGYWLGIYASIGVLEGASIALASYWAWVIIVPAASKNLHAVVLGVTMLAPMSFLSNTETGLLVNRFSQDMRLIDMILPRAFVVTGFQLFSLIAQVGVAIAALPYIAATLPFISFTLVMLQRFYLRTSRQLRLIEIETKAPLYSHFIDSLAGLATVRAFHWTPSYVQKTFRLLDIAQKPFYLLLCIQRWLELVLNLIVAAVSVLMVAIAVALRDRVNPGLLGVGLVMMTGIAHMMTDLIQSWTLLETSLGAIARVKHYAETTPNEQSAIERAEPEIKAEWPTRGALELKDVAVTYGEGMEPVLRQANLSIRAGEKFGLCGRSGSGKSSLVMSILRLAELASGQILIDGEDISTIPRSLVRRRISCLSQEPFMFKSSIRTNADPTGQASDAEIVSALQRVGVWSVMTSTIEGSESHVLSSNLDENLLSHGQRQLFCFARVLLKKSKVLLLDEPTSSLDLQTDAQVQKLIRTELNDCTIIMVAHRLNTLLDFDRVAVVDAGQIIEIGEPRVLMEQSTSRFAGLLEWEAATH
ncbi:putative ABC transporter [Thozetella sp. PMI_491]|nr:putative ABC transporter [Thozetella sp. PMI_491]